MAEQSKFAGALGRLNKRPAGGGKSSPQPRSPESPVQPESTSTSSNRGGKRSNPDYSPTTFFVRKDTKRRATQLLLEEAHEGVDLSDLVEELLARWVSEHSHA